MTVFAHNRKYVISTPLKKVVDRLAKCGEKQEGGVEKYVMSER